MTTEQNETTKKFLQDQEDKKQRLKPSMEFLHHIAITQAANIGFVIALIDGTSYETECADFMFTDGLSIVHDKHRIYIPKTAIKTILIKNPGDKTGQQN